MSFRCWGYGLDGDVGLVCDHGLRLNQPWGRKTLACRFVVLALLGDLQRWSAATWQLIDGLVKDVDVPVALNGLPNEQSHRL
ncbi:hypothetical protein [Streptomyces sp. NBC_01768]|uniref:hypothetical protein n=1 Tax=Streptomyces sp. NBC_01768 TaxID=2975938 RepID=UPI002DDC1276|nr:hypothetical protein [Streptomyces sp. NBC_01768]WSC32271.1 hypothetical protein OG902_39430 [Streptomyces sp. NBC_01768]